jgi:phosphatidylserine/phosphatidylglycerophosphate/cardiolipin synthase-like enzyme
MLADIAAAASSVHINQFGFRPGTIGEAFRDGADRQGGRGRPRQGRRGRAGLAARQVRPRPLRAPARRWRRRPRRARHAAARAVAAGGRGRLAALGVSQLGHIDHRKLVVIDGRIGWVGGAGIEDHFDDGRFHDLFVRLTGPVVSQLQLVFLATFQWLGERSGRRRSTRCSLRTRTPRRGPRDRAAQRAGAYRPITTAIAEALDGARETLDVVNPYVTDRA